MPGCESCNNGCCHEGKGIFPVAELYTEKDNYIRTKGCVSFEIINEGSSTAIVLDHYKIAPDDIRSFCGALGLPFSENIKLEFTGATGAITVLKYKLVSFDTNNSCQL